MMAVLFFGACEAEKIRAYTAPKDPVAAEPPPKVAGNDEIRVKAEIPPVTWKTPTGWTDKGKSEVNAAQFVVTTSAGEATVSITPLPNLAGKEAMVVNMWREQMGQKPLAPEELNGAFTQLEVAGAQGQLFEIADARDGSSMRIITAMLHRPDNSWFFKLAGPDAAVAEQKPVFLEFLKTVRIGDAASQQPAAPQNP